MRIHLLGRGPLHAVGLVDVVGHGCLCWFGGKKWEIALVSVPIYVDCTNIFTQNEYSYKLYGDMYIVAIMVAQFLSLISFKLSASRLVCKYTVLVCR